MCNWGTHERVWVFIPAELSHRGKTYWGWKDIDACIAPIVRALTEAGLLTIGSCCGHGKGDGSIVLANGRTLRIEQTPNEALEAVNEMAVITHGS